MRELTMIKAVIFDLDGVLVDARELHYEALNRSLALVDEKYVINREEHLSTFDGLPTTKKLNLLTEKRGLSNEHYDKVWRNKQVQTREIIDKEMTYDERIRGVLSKLKEDGYLIVVCSNSIRESTKMMLIRKGFMEYVEFLVSNEDVKRPKPNPEMYLQAMVNLGLGPKECMIVEDSHVGRQAAFESGAFLCAVENSSGLTYEKITDSISKATESKRNGKFIPKWQGDDLTIIIPMAGQGKRFIEEGYSFPKPLIDIKGKPMIQWVTENIGVNGRFIFIVTEEDYDKYNLQFLLNLLEPNCEIIKVKEPTNGAAETVLLAKDLISESPVAIINSDQYMNWNSNEFFYAMAADECDGGIVTFESTHPKWSFVQTGEDGFVTETAEKKPISNMATAGVYYFRVGSDFVKYAEQMIKKGLSVNGDYYVCPVFNELIADKGRVRAFPIEGMWSFSTPEDVTLFVNQYTEED
jgi:HAD superfamily hydrolase (TIGR01509 family)